MKVLCIILAILLGICLIGTGILYLYHRYQKKRWITAAEDNLRAGKEEASDIIRRTMDVVNADKKRMEAMADKEILIEAMTAHAALSRRLDRMEDKMEIVADYAASIDAMNKIIKSMEADLDALQTQFKDAAARTASVQQAVLGVNTAVDRFNTTLAKTDDVQKQLAEMTDNTKKTVKQLEGLDSKASAVVSDTNKMFDAYKSGPMETLRRLDEQMTAVDGTLKTISGKMDSVSITVSALRQSTQNTNA